MTGTASQSLLQWVSGNNIGKCEQCSRTVSHVN